MDDAERGSNATITVDLESPDHQGARTAARSTSTSIRRASRPCSKASTTSPRRSRPIRRSPASSRRWRPSGPGSEDGRQAHLHRLAVRGEDRLLARRRRRRHGLCLGHHRLRLRDDDDARDAGAAGAQRARHHRPARSRRPARRSRTSCACATTSPTWRTTTRWSRSPAQCFGDIRPAATMVVCGLTTPEMKIEIEVTARIGARES